MGEEGVRSPNEALGGGLGIQNKVPEDGGRKNKGAVDGEPGGCLNFGDRGVRIQM